MAFADAREQRRTNNEAYSGCAAASLCLLIFFIILVSTACLSSTEPAIALTEECAADCLWVLGLDGARLARPRLRPRALVLPQRIYCWLRIGY